MIKSISTGCFLLRGLALCLLLFSASFAKGGLKSEPFIVRPGTPIGGPAPPSTPDMPKTKMLFAAPLVSNKWNVTARFPDVFYRDSFSYTVALLVDGNFHCSGVIVGKDIVLTAGHCVTTTGSSDSPLTYEKQRLQVHVAAPDGKDCYKISDPLNGNSAEVCGGRNMALKDMPHLNPHFVETKGAPKNDLAVLVLDEFAQNLKQTPKLATLPSDVSQGLVTIAGYGYTGLPGDLPGDSVEVGWQMANFNRSAGQIDWDASAEAESTSCYFDSGGPVFLGRLQGYSDESPQVIGVVVGLEGSDGAAVQKDPAALCGKGLAVNALLTAPETRLWLCSVAPDKKELCPLQ